MKGAGKDGIRELVCISCPVGCRLEAVRHGDGSLKVTGNQCPRGEEYAREEVEAPKRIVTTTVRLGGGGRRRVPVRTDSPLPVEEIDSLLEDLHSLTLDPPVRLGDVIVSDVAGTGVRVVASLSME
jgi:CxxC motif-containing protein